MIANLNEAIQKIKQVGKTNVRCVPMEGQSTLDGDHQIEIKDGDIWSVVVSGIKRKMAEDIISQSLNRVICG